MVAPDTDESKASTLPDPELNPLLNPLLAAHMGRWAEVYFTSPPERRGEAVAELLRELEKNSTSESVSATTISATTEDQTFHKRAHEPRADEPSEVLLERSIAASEEAALVCVSCGQRNSALQKFCGMCGSALTNSWDAYPQVGEAEPVGTSGWSESKSPLEGGQRGREAEQEWRDEDESRDSAFVVEAHSEGHSQPEQPERNSPDFTILSGYQSDYQSDYESESAPHSYRIYAGVVLAILLALLVYMAWRGNAAFWGGRSAPSALPEAVPTPQPEAPAAAAAPQQHEAKVNVAPTAAAASPAPQTSRTTTAPSRRHETTRARPTARMLPVNAPSPTAAADPIGAEELATAERYLNGGAGTARDTRQAATWLWKAVAKQNLTATLLLSDLYLRGDGVPKSCDQARLLLDAAARKGATAAAERLRNLPAFGCQ
jgi:hypothetical protein